MDMTDLKPLEKYYENIGKAYLHNNVRGAAH
jgi:hypothetical protein